MDRRLTEFQESIRVKVELLGDQNHATSPFSSNQGGIRRRFDYRLGKDGEKSYGPNWLSHFMMVGSCGVQYAFKPEQFEEPPDENRFDPFEIYQRQLAEKPNAEFVIYGFNKYGCEKRAVYTESGKGIQRTLSVDFGRVGLVDVFGSTDIRRELSKAEKKGVMSVIEKSEEDAVNSLLRITWREKSMINAARNRAKEAERQIHETAEFLRLARLAGKCN